MDTPLRLHVVPATDEAFIILCTEVLYIVFVEVYGIYCQASCHSCCFVAVILTL
jgi:hypothetical protein